MTPTRLSIPLLDYSGGEEVVFSSRGQHLSRRDFLALAHGVAARLRGTTRAVFNLCEDRTQFAAGLVGALEAGITTLLPPNRAPRTLEQLSADWPGALFVDDDFIRQTLPRMPERRASVDPELDVVILFTSGSTGTPKPQPKRWSGLLAGSQRIHARLAALVGGLDGLHLVATVPPQHMFGLETSILLPLHHALSAFSGRPFYPADVADTLATLPEPRALVTTPLHLRACIEAGVKWPKLEFILSATDVLPLELAQQAEAVMGAPVLEIYGSSETGAVATRRTACGEAWCLLDGLHLEMTASGPRLHGVGPAPLALNDRIQLLGDEHFELLGRDSDLVNVAGKRASLADLNLKLRQIEGVEDGVIFMPEGGERPAGLVVAPGLPTRAVLNALAEHVDPVFLPRPLYRVNALPRNETGKLARQEVLRLFDQQRRPG
ncbi:MAG: AMP-binding protein [Pseudomonadota bacterium]|jgi:acyl-coenzyme A synthetase/AMP-(fatty) acid ligase